MTALSVIDHSLSLSFEGGTFFVNFKEETDKFVGSEPNEKVVTDGTISLKCCALSSDSKRLVFSHQKDLFLYEVPSWNLVWKKELKRSASGLLFSPKNNIIMADKSGDVYLFEGDNEGRLILGHISMILDVLITPDERFILTCDRDEKIRVSHFPNCYNIQSYCLGHKEFVMSMTLLSHREDLLVSAGGDSSLRIWDYINGKEILEYSPETKDAIIKIVSIKTDATSSKICAMINKLNGIAIFNITSSDQLKCSFNQIVNLDFKPLAMCLNKTDNSLWIVDKTRFSVFKTDIEVKQDFPEYLNKINSALEKHKIILDKLTNVADVVDSFYKKSFDNVDDYMKRKKDRIESENKKRKCDVLS